MSEDEPTNEEEAASPGSAGRARSLPWSINTGPCLSHCKEPETTSESRASKGHGAEITP